MTKPLRIAVVTSGRFHVCDLARELLNIGHDVTFYSLVPPSRTEQFGVPKAHARWMMPRILWAGLRVKLARTPESRNRAVEQMTVAFDRAVSKIIAPCDVLIGMSGMCNDIVPVVRKKYGTRVWIERGSRHVLSQQKIMSAGPECGAVSELVIARELKDYEHADRITVLSRHCEESFLEYGVSRGKLFRNPLGVNLKAFNATPVPTEKIPRIIMTGTWCWRKGCDVLVKACKLIDEPFELMHVGPVGDLPLPKDKFFVHIDRVEQSELKKYYASSTVFALASREEGLATVQPQALACGLRLVCTDRTGGEDLQGMIQNKDVITVVPTENVEAFANALRGQLRASQSDVGERQRLSQEERHEISWAGSARRYSEELISLHNGAL